MGGIEGLSFPLFLLSCLSSLLRLNIWHLLDHGILSLIHTISSDPLISYSKLTGQKEPALWKVAIVTSRYSPLADDYICNVTMRPYVYLDIVLGNLGSRKVDYGTCFYV